MEEAVVGGCGGDLCCRFVMDLEAFGFPLSEPRGLPIRLANDCELLDTWSSATNLGRCDWEDELALEASMGESCVTELRSVEYEVAPIRDCGLVTASRLARVGAPGRTGARGMEDEAPFRSKRLLRSFTLGWFGEDAALAPRAGRPSTGFEVERTLDREGLRLEDTAGCLGVLPSPLDRNDGRGMEAAIGRVSGLLLKCKAR